MRRSSWPAARLPAAVALAALVLVGCSPGADEDGTGQHGSGEHGETPAPTVSYDPEPRRAAERASRTDLDDASLPQHMLGLLTVDPGWDSPPQRAAGVMLAPGEDGGKLVFTATATDGEVLWTAERPVSCSGFTLSHDGERPLAILTDLRAADGAVASTTASAYDLHTGEQAWGPVDVPGPHVGPGLVFAASADEPFGEGGPRRVLDPATGETAAEGADVVGEFHGTVVLSEDEDVIAHDGSGDELWRLPDAGEAQSPSRNTLAPQAALIGPSPGDYALVSLAEGEILAEDLVDARFDPTSQTWVGRAEQKLLAVGPSGETRWTEPLDGDVTLTAAGGVMAYLLTEDDSIQARNAFTGELARIYDVSGGGPPVVPVELTFAGLGAIEAEDDILLVADQQDPEDPDAWDDGGEAADH